MSQRSRTPQLSKNLNELLVKHRMSLSKLARITGLNKGSIFNYMNGVEPSGLGPLMKISELFGISIDELVYGKDSNSPKLHHIEGLPGLYEIKVSKIL